MMGWFSDAAGWSGMVLLLVAFGAKHRMSRTTLAWLNLVGAALIGVNCVAQRAWPVLALQSVWALIAAHDLLTRNRQR